ncbi:hypothetical protein GSI_08333 [Ganoderma sinense ZZ0214-1]|uniref:Uncharacterized protein n=1 Tax=Ganoderma sinense ZZ0214-1 TaxID=1077348 RepID=A0A2G8S6Z7_9APHY|nr:hypothetical protein GSI_08333 [Ganoderma sinense ZZ0214-1]
MDSHPDERPAKRFKHESYKDTLKGVHLPSALNQTKFDQELADTDSHFHEALLHWQELNLAPAFLKFARDADPLSASMPLLLHNWKEIVEIWFGALEESDDEGLRAILDLFQKLAHDLRTTISPEYPRVLKRLLELLPRSLSAEALTALLATFSALFKYILVPSVDAELLQQAWKAFCDVLPQCHPEVQRAAAEVWGATLRRLKVSLREDAVRLIASGSTSGLGDACAWIFVTACKSVSQTLHTVTSSLVSPLVQYYLDADSPEEAFTLVRRVLTALIHHCKGADQFSAVSDAVVKRYEEVVKSADEERIRRILEVVTVVCSVRQGSRMSHKQLGALLSGYLTIPVKDSLHASLLKFATSVLTAGDMALWMAHARKVFDHAWERPLLGIELTGALSDLSWGGWKLVALPHVSAKTHKLLESHPLETLELLAALNGEKRLGDMDIVWKQRFEAWVMKALSAWEHSEEDARMLECILQMSSLLPKLTPLLAAIVDRELEAAEPREEYDASCANSAWVIGACTRCIAERPVKEWADAVDVSKWTMRVVEKWGWSGQALDGMAAVVRSSRASQKALPLDTVYEQLKGALLSHSRTLRLSTLRLLSSPIVQASEGTVELVKKALQAEEISVDVQGVRERVLRIGRLPLAVKDGDDIAADICARWLIAQLKVNLRPLWAPAASALSTLASRFGDLVWALLFRELQNAVSPFVDAASNPAWLKENADEGDVIWEDERSWRDPSAHKLRTAVAKWARHSAAEHAIVQSQVGVDRFDAMTYETQLLAVLEECATLAERHNRDLVPYFLALVEPDTPSRLPRTKLSAWLKLFAKFSNPNALRATDAMRALYVSLLAHPDRSLQRLALSCLLTYKSPRLVRHEDSVRLLLDDTKWRDQLTQLEFAEFAADERPEVVDVIIRLLYGTMLERRGRTRGADKRAAVLSSLAACSDEELELLVDLMLQPMRKHRPGDVDSGAFAVHPVPEDATEKQQVGFLTLLGDVLKHLGSRVVSRWPSLLETVIDLLAGAQTALDARNDGHAEGTGEEDVVDAEEEDEPTGSFRTLKSIRQLGLKRLADFFRCPVTYDFTPYMPETFRSAISPRLPSLDAENTQAPGALLDLFHAWAQRQEYAVYLVLYDNSVLPKAYDCLVATNVKPAVITKVFDIVEQLQSQSVTADTVLDSVFKPHVSHLLTNLSTLVSRSKGAVSVVTDVLGRRQIAILSELAPYLSDSSQAATLLELFSPLLRKPHKTVPEKIKVDMIHILGSLFPLIQDLSDSSSAIYGKAYGLLSQLFQTLRSRQARVALVKALQGLAQIQPTIELLAELLDSLNAYSVRRLEEPDFERRLAAFAELNDSLYKTLSCRDWLPIIYNSLSFIQDPLELTIRSNAATTLKRFVDSAADQHGEYEETFLKVLYPGLKNGLHSKAELVRAEILSVLSHAVARCDSIASLQEMRVLLAGGDEEANFFNNVHHIQIHRRSRAIRRLVDHVNQGHIRSATLAEVFIPLISNYVTSTASLDHHLVNEAILAVGSMAKRLNWGAYYALVQRYMKLAKQKDASERVYVRTIVAILDSFHFPMEDVVEADAVETLENAEAEDEEAEPEPLPEVARDATKIARIQDAVNARLLPSLILYLEKRDETEDSLRIPVAVGVVQIAKHLPQDSREAQVTKLLTVLSQALRSKSQETRDLVRETLCRIACTMGPSYLSLLIREMRGALLRGPHLHVLAYSVHALLVHVTTGEHAPSFQKLDDCVNDVATVSAEVIFGESGKDVQAEGFKTKMREVRGSSSKGVDSFALLAKHITPAKISGLLLPIRNIMQETETLKVMQQVEELLRRIAGGLNSNAHLVPTELLVLCHTLISQNARFLQDVPRNEPAGKGTKRKDHAIVQLKRRLASDGDHYANNSFRFVVFGLELFNTAYRRGRFDFKDVNVMSRLEPMVSIIGNTLYSSHMQVVGPGLKAAAAIVKCPLKSIDKSLPVLVRQIIEIIKQAGSTEPEAVQTAFKSLATILRDHPGAQVKEKDLVYLLELVTPDLEEPSRQAAVFTVLRAIIARRFVVPEIYDIMEKVAEIMVTNQSSSVQELARGALLQFLLDYPQGKGRLKNQMTFLVKNLSYVYESGRQSVMELLSAMISKFESKLVHEYSDLLFVGLVMVIANDEAAKCREMAAELVKGLLTRLETNQRNVIMSHVHSWASQHTQPQLTRVSAQLYGLFVDFLKADISPYRAAMLEDMNALLRRSALALESVATTADEATDFDESGMLSQAWQTPYHALLVFSKTLREQPELATEEGMVDWPSVVALLLFPHAWVRSASCRLLGTLFSIVPVAAPQSDESLFSLAGMEEIATKLYLQLKSENLDEQLGLQIVKNLFYVGKCFSEIQFHPLVPSADDIETDDVSDDEVEVAGDDERDDARRHPLTRLFSRLSYQARSSLIRRRSKAKSPANWSQQPMCVLKWFAAMASHLDAEAVEHFLVHILNPVYRVIEDDTIRDPQMEELKTLAVELQDLVQTKVGTTKFSNVYNSIRQKVVSVRRERKAARAIQSTIDPAAAAKRRLQRNIVKKDSRKRKNDTFLQQKGRAKRRKEG